MRSLKLAGSVPVWFRSLNPARSISNNSLSMQNGRRELLRAARQFHRRRPAVRQTQTWLAWRSARNCLERALFDNLLPF